MLMAAPHDEDPILVQMALQAVTSRVISRVIGIWDVRLCGEKDKLLSEIYADLFHRGESRGLFIAQH